MLQKPAITQLCLLALLNMHTTQLAYTSSWNKNREQPRTPPLKGVFLAQLEAF
jgi:hypothetical protein